MKKLCSTYDTSECSILRSILESNGIQCVVKNELLSPLAGGLPFNDVHPELWVAEEDFERGSEILSENARAKEQSDTGAGD